MKELIILGSTGSIGKQGLDVVRKRNDIKVTALTAANNVKLLEEQAREFKPLIVAVLDTQAAKDLACRLSDTYIKVLSGEEGIIEAAQSRGDTVLSAIVGIAGLRPTLAAINAKKTIALANKETMVTAGEIIKAAAKENGVKILPVDSEHSAIFQSLQGADEKSLNKIILTASGGPFYGKSEEELVNITAHEALKHPNWSMGNKITIDSATLMNKGLEVIEAVHLFDVNACDIEVVIHRQSIVHSAVELSDGAVIAQMGTPDMRLPIQYALTYPERGECFERLSLSKMGTLTFENPDRKTFRCLDICIDAINKGGLCPTIINAANEVAVDLFLKEKIGFLDIPQLIEETSLAINSKQNFDLDDIFLADKAAREYVLNLV
ncbi:MAG: 1-deoxy-D-xylulose-5-phosphate reductoisomerase [Clostridia bacterium]|nr:1-deoxy-D-xylulose-5-phosphate reductoisomerase [Clostridia bacterium]